MQSGFVPGLHDRTVACLQRGTHDCPVYRYKWDTLPAAQRPERGLLAIRAGLNAFANLRPAIVPRQVCMAGLVDFSTKATPCVHFAHMYPCIYYKL